MGVRKQEYLIIGCRFGKNFDHILWKDDEDKHGDCYDKYEDVKEGEEQWLLIDGMSGNYAFFGIIRQLSDGWDEGNCEIIELGLLAEKEMNRIKGKFQVVFPGVEMPEIKMYYVPHYC